MSKQLKRIKTCNTCGNKHTEVPNEARRDHDLSGWHYECSCGSTMFTPDKKISHEECDCEQCIEVINGCLRDCIKTGEKHICPGCYDASLDSPYDYEDIYFQADKIRGRLR